MSKKRSDIPISVLEELREKSKCYIIQKKVDKAVQIFNTIVAYQKSAITYHYSSEIFQRIISYLKDSYETNPLKSLILFLVSRSSYMKEYVAAVNLFACKCKTQKQFLFAKVHLESSLKMLKANLDIGMNKASTYLNLCTVYSNLGNHKLAHAYAAKGIRQAQEDLLLGNEEDKEHNLEVLVTAYYNCASELEHMNKIDKSREKLQKTIELINKSTGMRYLLEQCQDKFERLSNLSNSRHTSSKEKHSFAKKEPRLRTPAFDLRNTLEKKPVYFEQIRQTSFKYPDLVDRQTSLDSRETKTRSRPQSAYKSKQRIKMLSPYGGNFKL